MKKGICFALYGTKDEDALREWESFRKKLQERYGATPLYFHFLSEGKEEELRRRLEEDGITSLLLSSLVLEDGRTYQKLERMKEYLESMGMEARLTPPLLLLSGALDETAEAFRNRKKKTLLVLHGKHHKLDETAVELNTRLSSTIRAISLEGKPDVSSIQELWKETEIDVYPMMILGGTHTKKDILSSSPSSLFSRLKGWGYQPSLSKEHFIESPLLMSLIELSLEE